MKNPITTMTDLPIVRPRFPLLNSFHTDFEKCLARGQVTNGGQHTKAFESALSEYLAVPTLAFNNGQTALMTMLAAADVRGGEVICPSFTFTATPAAIVWAGATPIFADVDPVTMGLDPKSVDRKVTERTKAILGVDPYGIPCDHDELSSIASAAKVLWLVDSAASFGATYKGHLAGKLADAQIFSFHATKAFSTMEGGALCSDDENLLDRARKIRNFGQSDDGNCAEIGLNGKMTEVCSLVGLRQLEDWHNTLKTRKAIASFMRAELMRMEVPGVSVPRMPVHLGPTWLYRPIMISEDQFGLSRDQVVAGMVERGVWVRKYYSPACHLMDCYRQPYHDYCDPCLPVTEQLAANVIALPIYNDMLMAEVTRVATALREVWEANQCAS
jgi:dTDP-4-amino-4,6-dideoxyglucose